MRLAGLGLGVLLAFPIIVRADAGGPTTAPDAKSRIGPAVASLFGSPRSQQSQIRQQLRDEPELPLLLAGLLNDDDPVIRRTSLMLLRDDYGDWAVVGAVKALLSSELAQPEGGDGYVIAACCQILGDWPKWESIPVLLSAMRTDCQVTAPQLDARPGGAGRLGVWRQADASLRLVSGQWPVPEPDASGGPGTRPGSQRDQNDKTALQKAWSEWWQACSQSPGPLPQVRIELTWVVDPAVRAGAPRGDDERDLAAASLWVRPTGSVRHSRLVGSADALGDPSWQWNGRARRDYEFHVNAVQAEAVRSLTAALATTSAGTWGIARPAGLSEQWQGRLTVISPDGQTASVELAEVNTPDSVRPPVVAAEALAELLILTHNVP